MSAGTSKQTNEMEREISDPNRIFEPFHFYKMDSSIENDDAINLFKDGWSIKVFPSKILLDEDSVYTE